jgi:hypothetical protein
MAILSEVGLGLIEAGETGLACSIEWALSPSPNVLIASAGELTIGGSTYSFPARAFELPDGAWTIQAGRWDSDPVTIEVFPAAGFLPGNWEQLTILAGYGSGIEVVSGAIVGDVYVLKVV